MRLYWIFWFISPLGELTCRLKMNYIEWVGVITGVLAVYLLYRNNIMTWPVGFVNIACFIWIFWHQKLYGDLAVQLLFLGVGVFGWANWHKKKDAIPGKLSLKERLLVLLFTLLIFPLTIYYLKNYTDCVFPIAEAAILDLSIVGQVLTSYRKIENWLYWIVADVIMLIVYLLKDLEPLAIYSGIILVLGFLGLYHWSKLPGMQKSEV